MSLLLAPRGMKQNPRGMDPNLLVNVHKTYRGGGRARKMRKLIIDIETESC